MKINKDKIVFQCRKQSHNLIFYIDWLLNFTRGLRTIVSFILLNYLVYGNVSKDTFYIILSMSVCAILIKEKLDRL